MELIGTQSIIKQLTIVPEMAQSYLNKLYGEVLYISQYSVQRYLNGLYANCLNDLFQKKVISELTNKENELNRDEDQFLNNISNIKSSKFDFSETCPKYEVNNYLKAYVILIMHNRILLKKIMNIQKN